MEDKIKTIKIDGVEFSFSVNKAIEKGGFDIDKERKHLQKCILDL